MAKKRKTLFKDFEEILARGDLDECKAVFDRCEINAVIHGTNAFGCDNLYREFAIWLGEQGCDINYRGYRGMTPAFSAIKWNDDNLDLLIELGADLFIYSDDAQTVLHDAVTVGHIPTVEKLLKHGLDVNTPLAEGHVYGEVSTPLEFAFALGNSGPSELLKLTEFLVANGATVTEEAKELLRRRGEEYERGRDRLREEFMRECDSAYSELYKIIGITPPKRKKKQGGKSDKKVKEYGDTTKQFDKLWDSLVPSHGRAKSGQGECVRIMGRLNNEVLRNGCLNWDSDFDIMAQTLYRYLSSPTSIGDTRLKTAAKIIKNLNSDTSEEDMMELTLYTVQWVAHNPADLPLIEAEYER